MAGTEALNILQSGDPIWKTGESVTGIQGTVLDEWTHEEKIPLDLHTAASVGHEENLKATIKRLQTKDDLNKKNKGGWTPLMYAAYYGHSSVSLLLIQEGADLNSKNNRGHTSLILAAMCGNSSSLLTLLQNGARTEEKDVQGWTALFHACSSGHQNVVHHLISKGANINAVEQSRGMTVLMIAASAGHEIIVKDLLQFGADFMIKSISGETARSLAAAKGHSKVVGAIDQFTHSKIHCGHEGNNFMEHLIVENSLIRSSQLHQLFNGNILLPSVLASIQPSSPHLHGVADLQNLLDILGLTKYHDIFQKQNIDLPVFLTLSDKDLKDIGIELLGPRRKMTTAIARWHSNGLLIGNPLEQVYASKMQIENGELQKRLSELNVKLLQERDLRSFAEQCLNEERHAKQAFKEKIHRISQHLNVLVDKLKGATVNMHQLLYPNVQFSNPVAPYTWQVPTDPSVTRAMVDLINFIDSITIEISGQAALLLHGTGRQK